MFLPDNVSHPMEAARSDVDLPEWSQAAAKSPSWIAPTSSNSFLLNHMLLSVMIELVDVENSLCCKARLLRTLAVDL